MNHACGHLVTDPRWKRHDVMSVAHLFICRECEKRMDAQIDEWLRRDYGESLEALLEEPEE